MHTACVWSEKLPFAGYSVVKDSFMHTACAVVEKLPFADIHCQRPELAVSLQPTTQRHESRVKLVENTGLEPVTSWLQTRRSPS